MFQNPFSFNGRIRRLEYGLSFIIYMVAALIVSSLIDETKDGPQFIVLAFVPMLWFLWAQGAKRCHDLGNNGYWQIIPFYGFWMLFQDGLHFENEYGDNPKGINTELNDDYSPGLSVNVIPAASGTDHNASLENNVPLSNPPKDNLE